MGVAVGDAAWIVEARMFCVVIAVCPRRGSALVLAQNQTWWELAAHVVENGKIDLERVVRG